MPTEERRIGMKERLKIRKGKLTDYAVVYVEMPEFPEIERFIYTKRKTIYINLSARPGAKIIKLVQ